MLEGRLGRAVLAGDENEGRRAQIISSKKITHSNMKNGPKGDENLDKSYLILSFCFKIRYAHLGEKKSLLESSVAKWIKLGTSLSGRRPGVLAAVQGSPRPRPVPPSDTYAPHSAVCKGCCRWVKMTFHQMTCKMPVFNFNVQNIHFSNEFLP